MVHVTLRASLGAQGPSCAICGVRRQAICSALSVDQLPKLAQIAASRALEPGQTLFHEGDPAEDLFTVTTGMIKLFKLMPDGRRQIMGFVLPGDVLGLSAQQSFVYSAEAVTPAEVCRFRRPQLDRLLEEAPALEKALLARATSELAAAQEQMLLLGRKSARERLASFLVGLAQRLGAGSGTPFELAMTRTDIADYLGLTIETVSRTLTQLRREGLIELTDKAHVVIRDPDALHDTAQG